MRQTDDVFRELERAQEIRELRSRRVALLKLYNRSVALFGHDDPVTSAVSAVLYANS